MPPKVTKKKTARKRAVKKAVKKKEPRNEKARAVVANARKAAKKATKKAVKKKVVKRKKPRKHLKSFLAKVLEEFPGITSDQLAIKYEMKVDDVVKMRHFVHEYIKDFNAYQAALRMGYSVDMAINNAQLLMEHSFTQLRLAEIMKDVDANSIISGNQVMFALWREANLGNNASNAAGRISALKELARIKRIGDTAQQKAVKVTGVMIVPMVENDAESSWEDKAKASQAALKGGAIDV